MDEAGYNPHFLPRSPFAAMLLFAFFIGLCTIITVWSVPDSIQIKKRQDDEPNSNSMSTVQEISKPKRTRELKVRKLSKEDQDALKAARMFFENDGLTFAQALGRHNVHNKDLTVSIPVSNSGISPSHPIADKAIKDIKPFSIQVLRHGGDKKPVGYDSGKQRIARFAEKYIAKGLAKSDEIALNMAKDKLKQRLQRKYELIKTWRKIAKTDPSKAREMKTQVPKRLSRKDYVPLRAHQLHHQGKAPTMEIATQVAKEEIERELSLKRGNRQKAESSLKKL